MCAKVYQGAMGVCTHSRFTFTLWDIIAFRATLYVRLPLSLTTLRFRSCMVLTLTCKTV